MYKNHEGYYDPTAAKAIRRDVNAKGKDLRRRKKIIKEFGYYLGELPFFKELRR